MNEPPPRQAEPVKTEPAVDVDNANTPVRETRTESMSPDPTSLRAALKKHEARWPTIEGFEILGRVGRGGMGEVLEARQISLQRKVAIKVLAAELVNRPGALDRFDREAATLARLMHPNIVTIFERGRSGEQVYFIMEFVEGGADGRPRDLRRLLEEGLLEERVVRKLMLQVADALEFAHSQGVVHRDVKPSNVMIDRHGNAKVADFGIASASAGVETALTGAMTMLGTLDYMAPEQRRDAAAVDHRADIYAAGVMLYELLTGELPVGAHAPPSKLARVSPAWDAVVARAMRPRPEDRFPRMSDLREAIERIAVLPTEPIARSETPRSEDPVVLARVHFERARSEGSLQQRFENSEHAGLLLAGVMKRSPNPEVDLLLKEVNRHTAGLARQITKQALRTRDLSTARKFLEWLADCDPASLADARRLLGQIDAERKSMLEEARRWHAAGKYDEAIERLQQASKRISEDGEIVALLAQWREQRTRLRAFLDQQFPWLETERRYVQIAREIGQLRARGLDSPALRVLATQVAERIQRADNLVRRAQEHADAMRLDRAEKKGREALAIVSDHAGARVLLDGVLVRKAKLAESTRTIEALLAAGHWFSARRRIRRLDAPALQRDPGRSWAWRAQTGCDASNRGLAYVLFSVVGGALLMAVVPLALRASEMIAGAELFQNLASTEGVRCVINSGVMIGFALPLLLPLSYAAGGRIRWRFVLLIVPVLVSIGLAYDYFGGQAGMGANAAHGLTAIALALLFLGTVGSMSGSPGVLAVAAVFLVSAILGAGWPEPANTVLSAIGLPTKPRADGSNTLDNIVPASGIFGIAVWSGVCGLLALLLRDRFEFRLHLMDRLGFVRAGHGRSKEAMSEEE